MWTSKSDLSYLLPSHTYLLISYLTARLVEDVAYIKEATMLEAEADRIDDAMKLAVRDRYAHIHQMTEYRSLASTASFDSASSATGEVNQPPSESAASRSRGSSLDESGGSPSVHDGAALDPLSPAVHNAPSVAGGALSRASSSVSTTAAVTPAAADPTAMNRFHPRRATASLLNLFTGPLVPGIKQRDKALASVSKPAIDVPVLDFQEPQRHQIEQLHAASAATPTSISGAVAALGAQKLSRSRTESAPSSITGATAAPEQMLLRSRTESLQVPSPTAFLSSKATKDQTPPLPLKPLPPQEVLCLATSPVEAALQRALGAPPILLHLHYLDHRERAPLYFAPTKTVQRLHEIWEVRTD